MLVRDVMTRNVCTIAADETLRAAALEMRSAGIGALAVCDAGRAVGIVTDRDLVVRGIAAGGDPDRDRVRGAMTAQVISCSEEDELERAAAIMRDACVRRLLVTDAAERPLGLLSVDDVALADPQLAGEIIEHGLAPERPPRRLTWPWWE